MKNWTPDQIAGAAGATLVASPAQAGGPDAATIDSRGANRGALFVGLQGAIVDGGQFAAAALGREAWGVLVTPQHADRAAAAGTGTVLAAADPLSALQRLATAWRRHLGAHVIGITGSTGKTSTKELLLAILAPHRRTVASRANFNTEIGLPLEILSAPEETEVLVLEMGMRGAGQIAELARIAEPDVGVIVSIGPVHLELLGSIEGIAAAKAELIAALPRHGTAIVPAGEPLLTRHLRKDITTVTFGEGGDVRLLTADATATELEIDARRERIDLEVPFTQAHLRLDLLAAVAAAQAVGVTPRGRVELALSAGRGLRRRLERDITVIDDCYNANPVSMRAALDDLTATATTSRRVAVLGDMLELGPRGRDFHAQIGAHAAACAVDVLVTVGPLAAAMSDRFDGESYAVDDANEAAALVLEILAPGDTVLVKASRGVGLELVCRALGATDDA